MIYKNIEFTSVLTDSRSLGDPAGVLFAAIPTEVNDGHNYIPGLYEAGVRNFLVDRAPEKDLYPEARFLVVDSVIGELAAIAANLAGQAAPQHIVVTGSIGKSTVKELIYRALLADGMKVRRSPVSWNSYLGVILSMIENNMDDRGDSLISEIGIDGPGQARRIVGDDTTQPLVPTANIGVLTPITAEHDESFWSHRDKIIEKLMLLRDARRIVFDTSDSMVEPTVREFFKDKDVELVPVSGTLADLASAAIGLPVPQIEISTRVDLRESDNGNLIVRSHFTPDFRSLRHLLDIARRHSSPDKPAKLVLGNLLHGQMTEAEIRYLYEEAARVAGFFGVSEVIPLYDECGTEIAAVDPESFKNNVVIFFGLPQAELDNLAAELESAGHNTYLEVDLDALVYNYNYYRRLLPAGTGMVGMVKASAYGLGAVEVGKTLQSAGAKYLAVAVIEEGVSLREAGVTMPIMVLNPITNRYKSLFAHRLEPTVFSLDELNRLIGEAAACGTRDYPVHIKLDTGMHRVGFLEKDLESIASIIKGQDYIKVASVFSHLATADCPDLNEYTQSQIRDFEHKTSVLESALGYKFKRHILNTAGMMRFAEATSYELARLGIGLYGVTPLSDEPSPLKTVAAFRTRIVSLKRWGDGTPIGYGCKGRTSGDSLIATIPVGYADGINRHLGNGNASFLVNGQPCPTIGNICMDQCMIDVTGAPGVAVGDAVEIFGARMPVERLSDVLGTIPYEILTSVSPRVKRLYFIH